MKKSTHYLAIGLTAAGLSLAAMSAALAFGSDDSSSSSSSSSSKSAGSESYTAAMTKINAGDYASAIPLLQQSLASNPKNPDALNELGFSYRKLGHLSDSLDAYRKALAIEPNHIDANEYLGELYLQMKRPDLAKQQLTLLDKLCPSGCEQRTELQEKISGYQGS